MKIDPEGGYILVDKPLTWTSFQVVNKVKYLIKHRVGQKIKVGHAGTLDPLASGLLILCYGKMTKEISRFQDMKKVYSGVFVLGATTPSFDRETEVDQRFETTHIDAQALESAVKGLTGTLLQAPPLYSAKRIEGERAYELARRGEDRKLDRKQVDIYRFDVELTESTEVKFEIECSKGTYIRSLARDLGEALNSGAYLKSLRREAIGSYHVKDAHTIEDLINNLGGNANE